jgi:hypothetical protein
MSTSNTEIKFSTGKVTAYKSGTKAFDVELNGNATCTFGRVSCGKFGEKNALNKFLRCHNSLDNTYCEVESFDTIPFGCEFDIRRTSKVCNNFAIVITDVSAVSHGRVGNLTQEPITFDGPWVKVEYLANSAGPLECVENREDQEIYNSATALHYIKVTYEDNSCIEFYTGSDYWRHNSGSTIEDCSSNFNLSIKDGAITYTRNMLIYGDKAEIEKRPWRFKSIIAWQDGKQELLTSLDDAQEITIKEDACFLSPASRRAFKKQIRKAKSNIILSDAYLSICNDGSHIERAGKTLEHCDLEEYLTDWLWANKQLKKSNFAFIVKSKKQGILKDSCAIATLASVPEELDVITPDEEY